MKAVVNHRINTASSHSELEEETITTLTPVVKTYNLTLVGFKGEIIHHGNPSSRVLVENAYSYYTDPAPRSPTDASDPDSSWTVMASTARGVWASRKAVSEDGTMVELAPGEDLVMAPYMSTGVGVTLSSTRIAPNDDCRTPIRGDIGISQRTFIGSDMIIWTRTLVLIPSTRGR